MRSRNCSRRARRWIARLHNATALLAVSVALSACGGKPPQPSALELLRGGHRPYSVWELESATDGDVAAALDACIDAVGNDDVSTSAPSALRDAGWQSRPYPDEMVTFIKQAARDYVQGKGGTDQAAERDPVLNPANWPEVFERNGSPVLLALAQVGDGKACSVLADTGKDNPEAISRAVASLDRDFSPRTETPHGFRWQSGEISIFEDYGDGLGGRWEFTPPIFAPIKDNATPQGTPAANVTVYNCKGTC